MKTVLCSCALLFLAHSSFSQNKEEQKNVAVDPRQEFHYKEVAPIENDVFKVSFHDMHSQATFTQVLLEVANKSDDYLVFDMNKIGFTYEGKGTYYDKGDAFNQRNIKIIEPKTTKKFIVKAKDLAGWMQVDKFHLTIDGISTYAVNGVKTSPPDFQLPSSNKLLEQGVANIYLLAAKQVPGGVWIDFQVDYKGKEALLVEFSKFTLKTASGEILPNKYPHADSRLILPNLSAKGKLDVAASPKAVNLKKDTVFVQFNSAFTELHPKALNKIDADFELDVVTKR